MKSSLKVPKYKVCSVLMQRQLDELRGVVTMSEHLSIHSDEERAEDRILHTVVGSMVGSTIERNERKLNSRNAENGKCCDRYSTNEIQPVGAKETKDSVLALKHYDEKKYATLLHNVKTEESKVVRAPGQCVSPHLSQLQSL